MKLHISPEQLNELSDKGKKKLREWWKPQEGDWVIYIKSDINDKREDYFGEMLLTDEPYLYGNHSLQFFSIHKEEKKDYLPLLSIGQMIEFLDENKKDWTWDISSYYENQWKVVSLGQSGEPDYRKRVMLWEITQCYPNGSTYQDWNGELCDTLWEAVKEVLEKKDDTQNKTI